MSDDFALYKYGVPEGWEDAEKFKKALDSRGGDAYFPVRVLDDTNAKIMDKSIGLLQADSILIAIAMFYLQEQQRDEWWMLAPPLLAIVACLLLMLNLKINWSSQHSAYADPDKAYKISWLAALVRAKRFTWALWLSLPAFLAQTVMIVYPVAASL